MTILAIANTKKTPGCYVSRCIVGSCGGNIVSGARAGVTGEACTYVYLYWFTFIIVRPAQWQPRKNDPLDYWSQLNVNWKLGNDVSAKIKQRKCGTGTCTICGNHAGLAGRGEGTFPARAAAKPETVLPPPDPTMHPESGWIVTSGHLFHIGDSENSFDRKILALSI